MRKSSASARLRRPAVSCDDMVALSDTSVRGHVLAPRSEHVALDDLARAAGAGDRRALRGFAWRLALEQHPIRTRAGKAAMDAVVGFEIVRAHDIRGRIRDIRIGDSAAEKARRRALEAEDPDFEHGLVDRERPHHAKLLERWLEDDARVKQRVVDVARQDRLRPLATEAGGDRLAIAAQLGILRALRNEGVHQSVAVRIAL